MDRFQYFNHWTDEQCRDCLGRAKVRTFNADEVIFEEGRSPVNYVHFVLSGSCMILQCLKIIKTVDKYGCCRYRLAEARPIEDEFTQVQRRRSSRLAELQQSQSTPQTVESSSTSSPAHSATKRDYEYHFVDIGSYSCGSVFGVGEHMDDRSIVARNAMVQCLVIPRYWLLQKPQNSNNVWSRIRIFIEQRQPSRQQLFQWYIEELRWRLFRRKLRDNASSVRAMKYTTGICDVPTLGRIEDSDVFA